MLKDKNKNKLKRHWKKYESTQFNSYLMLKDEIVKKINIQKIST
jgi:hypothetical protein